MRVAVDGNARLQGRARCDRSHRLRFEQDMTSSADSARCYRDLRSFGRRKGRKLGAAQQGLLDELLPKLRLDPAEAGSAGEAGEGCQDVQALARLFNRDLPPSSSRQKPQPVWLEIGFGGGEHLVWQASNNPHVNFIGCEPFVDGVVKVLRAVESRKLSNIRLYDDDARALLRRLPAASIDRGFLLFPDPWPKKRQQKRRLVSTATLDLLGRVMTPGAELRIATDIADYARAILLAVMTHPEFEWLVTGPDDWRKRPADWPQTRYEQKARRAGRRCSYFSFRRR